MAFHWLGRHQPFPGPIERLHPYAVYGLFGIPAGRWLACVTRQAEANEDERLVIRRYRELAARMHRPFRSS